MARAQTLPEAQALFKSGKYAECIAGCEKQIAAGQWSDRWWMLKIRAELTIGKTEAALKSYETGIQRQPESVQLRVVGFDVLRANDRPDDAMKLLDEVRRLVAADPQQYGGAADRTAVGRALLLAGADPRQVLELLFDRAKKDEPTLVDPHLASGELALSKNDFAVAAESFAQAVKLAADDPEAHFGLARAYANDDPDRATASLKKALELNPNHVPGLLYRADNAIDREGYDDAKALLDQVLKINPKNPDAWSYRAVLAHLTGDAAQEKSSRDAALSTWHSNPQVDHLIGKKISQKYRFAEGQAYQRRALELDATFAPAKIQLAQDLLRLGREDEGWRLADEVFAQDKYNVQAYNLTLLRDHVAKFDALKDEHFLVRIDPREHQIYGRRVSDVLKRAREKLCAKYGVTLSEPTTVEIFPQQKDFAIRTFGLPGGAGYLGVCFGDVVTVNSPASRQGRPSNWAAVLWHEFCHVVTLNKTRNKMPRWLSEGISVYEERQENPAWGQRMTVQYREFILNGQAAPVSKLSGAFLKPPSPMHLQFAYFESSMVVDHVIERFGIEAIKQVLDDLAKDVPINDALANRTEPIDKLDANFAAWLKSKTEQLAPGADLERPEMPLDADSATARAWNQAHPNNFFGLLAEGQALIAEQKFQGAVEPLRRAVKLYPDFAEVGGPYVLLAAAYRGMNDVPREREMLEKHASLSADAVEARVRLLEILAGAKDWPAVRRVADEVLAINPLIPAPHRFLAQAAEATGDRSVAIDARRTLLLMDPLDRAEQHYRLARALFEERQVAPAKRQVLMALEEAPRYREALRLLLEIEKVAPAVAPARKPPVTTAPSETPAPDAPVTPASQPTVP